MSLRRSETLTTQHSGSSIETLLKDDFLVCASNCHWSYRSSKVVVADLRCFTTGIMLPVLPNHREDRLLMRCCPRVRRRAPSLFKLSMRTETAFSSMHMRFRGVSCVWRALSAFTRSSASNAQLKRMFGRVCPAEVLRGPTADAP